MGGWAVAGWGVAGCRAVSLCLPVIIPRVFGTDAPKP